jgi:hypothetical protein
MLFLNIELKVHCSWTRSGYAKLGESVLYLDLFPDHFPKQGKYVYVSKLMAVSLGRTPSRSLRVRVKSVIKSCGT